MPPNGPGRSRSGGGGVPSSPLCRQQSRQTPSTVTVDRPECGHGVAMGVESAAEPAGSEPGLPGSRAGGSLNTSGHGGWAGQLLLGLDRAAIALRPCGPACEGTRRSSRVGAHWKNIPPEECDDVHTKSVPRNLAPVELLCWNPGTDGRADHNLAQGRAPDAC